MGVSFDLISEIVFFSEFPIDNKRQICYYNFVVFC